MIVMGWIRQVQQPDQPASFYGEWLDTVKRFHEFIFITIESNIILAALYAGASKTGSLVLYALYGLAWVGLFWFVEAYLRFSLHAAAEKYELPQQWRGWFLRLAFVFSLIVAVTLPMTINSVVRAIIQAQT